MNIHEYQAKALLREQGVPTPLGYPAFDLDQAYEARQKLVTQTTSQTVVVKAQIHAGGRGKAGGVKVCKTKEAAQEAILALFGTQLVTHQTGKEGRKVSRLLIEEGVDILKEFYLAVLLDRQKGRLVVIASTEGGMDIEEVAAHHPEKLLRYEIDPALGFCPFQAREIAIGLGFFELGVLSNGVDFITRVVAAYQKLDCELLEINPLVVTKQGKLIALDAKVSIEDNALFRHPDFASLRDPNEEDPMELEAKKYDLSYIKLDGNIGCMVNGAGLAMGTLDIIAHYQGMPANFLDVGGGASVEKVTAAFKIITSDPAVKGIFVNIFGGIMKCDVIAEGIVTAVKEVGLKVPLVVRLEGTRVEYGQKILQESGLPIVTARDMKEGAFAIVRLVKGEK